MTQSIVSNGWKGITERTLLNFLVNSLRGTMFIESIDASSYSKTGERVFHLLDSWVERIGEKNVVQVITDNASNYVMAGKILRFVKIDFNCVVYLCFDHLILIVDIMC